MNSKLRGLMEEFPIPGWSPPEVYSEHLQIQDFHLDLVGLSISKPSGEEITASAAGFDDTIYTRAYFELLERFAIIDFESQKGESNQESTQGQFWRYSKSNGVAAHITRENACQSARLELQERDAVLRSWYYNSQPEFLKVLDGTMHSGLKGLYQLEAYRFQGASPVVGVFGFPLQKALPLFFGFGAHSTWEGAIEHAIYESYQRLGFTWGEALPEKCPEMEPTPLFHLNYYLDPEKLELIRLWLRGEMSYRSPPFGPGQQAKEIQFLDLTPDCLKGKANIVKAVSGDYMPLTFGSGHPWLEPVSGPDSFPHPIS